MPAVVTTLDTTGVDAMLDDLARFAARPRSEVLLPETARVLEVCVRYSPGKMSPAVRLKTYLRVEKPSRYIGPTGASLVPFKGKVPRDIVQKNLQTLTGQRGGTAGAQYMIQGNRQGERFFLRFQGGGPAGPYRPSRWNMNLFSRLYASEQSVAAAFEAPAQAAIKAIGSMKKSWVQMGDAVGAPLRGDKVPGWVRSAVSQYDDGANSHVVHEEAALYVDLVNTNAGLIRRYDGASILQGAIDTRKAAFIHELKHEVFADLERRALVHPGVFVG